MATRVFCACDRRRAAQLLGELLYVATKRAWVFTDVAPRSMSAKARLGAFVDRREFPHPDHDGEPYYFQSCIFCGYELPGTDETAPMRDATGDPEL